MSKTFDFLKECGAFYVLTVNGDCPAGRPFGAIMETDNYLYLSTNDMNQAHKQIRVNGNIQIVAKKPDSREWIRISGVASECDDAGLKERMLKECPVLKQRFDAVGYEHFILLKVRVDSVECTNIPLSGRLKMRC